MNDKLRLALIEIGEHLEDSKKINAEALNMPGPAAVRQLANVQEFLITTLQHLVIAQLGTEDEAE